MQVQRFVACLIVACAAAPVAGQDYFPEQVPVGSADVGIRDFARLPNSGEGLPARMSVMTSDPSGRLFVNDQRGPLYTVSDDGATVTPYLDLSAYDELAVELFRGEQGFQSFAFHPDFLNAGTAGYGRFYTLSSTSNTDPAVDFEPGGNATHHEILLEWQTATPEAGTFTPADADRPYREVMRIKQPFANHNGGLIAFNTTDDPSDRGNLYVALGDGGSTGDPRDYGQDAGNPYGAILRIDPLGNDSANGRYGIVAGNALAADGDPETLGEIYAYGFRNPQQFGWDDATGDLYVGDIGQSAVEEIDRVVNGGNYGWNEREGSFPYRDGGDDPSFIDPVAEYDHTNPFVGDLVTERRAVTVGEVVRGSEINALNGLLLAGDFPTGVMLYLDVDDDPLDGGQGGLRELLPKTEDGEAVRLIELIRRERQALGLSSAFRADLRYSLGTDGRIFVLNKQDGVIREFYGLGSSLTAIPSPAAWTGGLVAFGLVGLGRRRSIA